MGSLITQKMQTAINIGSAEARIRLKFQEICSMCHGAVVGKTLGIDKHFLKSFAPQAEVTGVKNGIWSKNTGSDHTMDCEIVGKAEKILDEQDKPKNFMGHMLLTSSSVYVKAAHRTVCHLGNEDAKILSLKRSVNTLEYALEILGATNEDYFTKGIPLPPPFGHKPGTALPRGWPTRGPPMKEFGTEEGPKGYDDVARDECNTLLNNPAHFNFE